MLVDVDYGSNWFHLVGVDENGYVPLHEYGIERVINKMQVDENIDLTMFEVEQIVKAVDSHSNISTEYGISKEQVYLIKANFR